MYQYNCQTKRYSQAKPIDIKTQNVAQDLGKQPDQVLKFMIYDLYAQVEDLKIRLDLAKKSNKYAMICKNCDIHIAEYEYCIFM